MKTKYVHYHLQLLKSKDISLYHKYVLHTHQPAQPFTIKFKGKKIQVPDARSFLGMYRELFIDQHYYFQSSKPNPRILDCGANIGLAAIYFKSIYPKARITGFEPDEQAFAALQQNLKSFNYQDIELVKKAVWTTDTGVKYVAHGGTGGRIEEGEAKSIAIPSVRLKDILEKEQIDFLKIDIEGAELEVIKDCEPVLHKAQNIFIEYHSMANAPQQLHVLLQLLANNGFRYHIKEAFTSALPFVKIEQQTGMDLQLNIFAYK